MNGVRLRIVQYMMAHEEATTAQIQEALQDVPPATLYRHVKILRDSGLLEVVRENQVRGVVERIYHLNPGLMGRDGNMEGGLEEIRQVTGNMLLLLMDSYNRYFTELDKAMPGAEKSELHGRMQKDGYFLNTAVLLLNDAELRMFLQKISQLYNEVLENGPGEGRMLRRFTLLSSPVEAEPENLP